MIERNGGNEIQDKRHFKLRWRQNGLLYSGKN